MEPGMQSSFIPHDAASATPLPRDRSGGGLVEVGLLISIVLLVASGALAAAVFLYGQYAQTSGASKLDQLQRAEAAFEPSLIQQLTRLDDRMQASETILNAHLAPLAFFDALQQTTLTTVSFQTLDFEAPDPQHMTIKMSGVGEEVNSIALQADLFSKSGVITNPIFSDISRQTDGVHFTLTAAVNPTAINYVQLLGAASSPSAAIQSAASQQGMVASSSSPFGGSAAQQQTQTGGPVQTPTLPASQSTTQPGTLPAQ
jgi:hypothetical protein